MRIGINAFFLKRPETGSGQYTRHLLEALAKADSANEYVLFSPGSAPRSFRIRNLSENLAKLWFEQISFPRACRRLDLAHVPYFASPLFPTTPTVVTIHDLIPLILPAYRGSLLMRAYTHLVAEAAKRADAVIADSQASKRDTIRLLGIPPERVHVVYLAADEAFRLLGDDALMAAVRRKYNLPPSYFLYLGGFDQRKNIPTLLRAFVLLGSKHVKIVIAGRLPERDTPFFPNPRRLVCEFGLEGKVTFTGWVPEEDKPALYSGARAFIFPSLYEGFGLPVLEAMTCGTPVIASDRTSLPEVVGEGGILVNPEDAEGMVEAMEVLLDDDFRAELGR
ncbi:MAG: glycosyltransferase family 1 protein, partial [Chloroflexota bacterium]|nr:glycosyltransferase family 1 protein [Chloroflexota bacterium]